jgi:hypothetical protein
MSWSVGAIGRPAVVAAKIAADLSQYSCVDPEEGVKQAVGAALAVALAAQDPSSVVKVAASGSQGTNYVNGKSAGFTNSLNISVEPIHGFVE